MVASIRKLLDTIENKETEKTSYNPKKVFDVRAPVDPFPEKEGGQRISSEKIPLKTPPPPPSAFVDKLEEVVEQSQTIQSVMSVTSEITSNDETKQLNKQSESTTISNTSANKVDQLLDDLISKNRNKITVIGVGGGGCNAITRLSSFHSYKDAILVSVNTDAIHLRDTNSNEKILLGLQLTEGLGAGNDPVIGKAAAEESLESISNIVKQSDMVFVTTGLGGGTGTGAAPVIAREAKASNALVVGICTLPFEMEGEIRAKHAIDGLREFYQACDTVIVIPNEKLMDLVPDLPIGLAFKVADEILVRAVRGIVNLIRTPAYVNVDFADIKQILKQGGSSVIGMGEGEGENRVNDALRESLSNSLLDIQIMDCKAALINITGGPSLSLEEVRSCVQAISQEMGEDSEIIWGTHIDPTLGEKIQVTTILSGVSSPYNLNFETTSSETDQENPQIKSIWD